MACESSHLPSVDHLLADWLNNGCWREQLEMSKRQLRVIAFGGAMLQEADGQGGGGGGVVRGWETHNCWSNNLPAPAELLETS